MSVHDTAADRVREFIDKMTLDGGLGEYESMLLGAQVCAELQSEYEMRAMELED